MLHKIMSPDTINSIWLSSEVWKFEGQVGLFLAGVLLHALSVELDFSYFYQTFPISVSN